MSTKIYNAFIVKAKNPTSLSVLMNIAQNARRRMLDAFRDNFGNPVLIRLFKIVDLVAFYGDDILEMDKFIQLDDNNKELIQKWIKIRNTHPDSSDAERHLMLWYAAVDSMTTSLKKLENEYHESNHKAKIMFIPCGRNKTLGMFFGDYFYYNILFKDTENIADYHYQNQTDKPDDVSDAEWKRREKDWDRAIGPDYIPLNHGMEFTLLDYNNVEEDMLMIKSGKYIYEHLDEIAKKRIANVLATVDPDDGMFPEMSDDMTVSERINIINRVKSTDEYKKWEEKTRQAIADKLGIALQ